MPATIQSTAPVLASLDLDETLAFYVDRLGFTLHGRWGSEYLIVQRDGCELHFWHCTERHIAENTSVLYPRRRARCIIPILRRPRRGAEAARRPRVRHARTLCHRSARQSVEIRAPGQRIIAFASAGAYSAIVSTRRRFQRRKPAQGMRAVIPAHQRLRAEAGANGRSFRMTKDAAAMLLVQLHTMHAGRLAVGHGRDRRADRGRDAAGAASRAAGPCTQADCRRSC